MTEGAATDCVFTLPALEACLEQASGEAWYRELSPPEDGSWNVFSVEFPEARFFVHRDDLEHARRIIIVRQDGDLFRPAPPGTYRILFERIARVAREAQHPPVVLPEQWNAYRHDNLMAFFALRREDGALRWIAELRPRDSEDICFWKITTPDDPVGLDQFKPSYDRYGQVVGRWSEAFSAIKERFAALPAPPQTEALQPTVDLDVTTFGAVTQHRTYSTWLDHLTARQRKFVEAAPDHPIKLRGPAGTGKTLALELKALREIQRAKEEDRPIRILFATHSWTVAEQVDAALRGLSELEDISAIDVFPLLSMAQGVLPSERAGHGFDLLGEDSLSGKQAQLERIGELLEEIRSGDWLAFRSRVSEAFALRVESDRDSLDRAAFVWDLIGEFASVLSANGILPGVNAERQYLAIPRSPWMMPLANDAELQFVLLVYSQYVRALQADGLLSSDQLINDFLNYLETFAWNIRRERDGYDLIFVDELHLFNEQERLALHYLTRSADEYPKMFMALDPRQSPAEVYAGVPAESVSRGESGAADVFLGEIRFYELDEVHRFSPEILALIRHINQSFPALDLGPDWKMDLSAVESAAPAGDVPTLVIHDRSVDERAVALRSAVATSSASPRDERTALVLIEPLELNAYKATIEESHLRVTLIQSRDDVEQLRYARRSLIVGAAEYVAGLQFDRVVIAGLPETASALAKRRT